MPKILSKALLSRLSRSSIFRDSLRELHEISGMDCIWLDGLGNELFAWPRQPSRDFLRRLRVDPSWQPVAREARQALLAAGSGAEVGYYEVPYAVRVGDEAVGWLVLSACRDAKGLALQALRNHWTQHVKAGSACRWEDILREWEALPVVSPRAREGWHMVMHLYLRRAVEHLESHGIEKVVENLPPLVRKGCDWVHRHFNEPLWLRGVAQACGVSPEHFSRVFHQSTGIRFGEYLAETRVSAACSLLHDTDDPIGDIADRCGFSTLSRFNRCFRERVGMTPREWRRLSRPPERLMKFKG